MEDLHEVGGTPAVLKYLLERGLIDGSCLTVTGKTLAENLEAEAPLAKDQTVIHPLRRRSKTAATFGSCEATSLLWVPWPRSLVRKGSTSKDRQRPSIVRKTCWRLSNRGGSSLAMSW